jgi:hypothetical protein
VLKADIVGSECKFKEMLKTMKPPPSREARGYVNQMLTFNAGSDEEL